MRLPGSHLLALWRFSGGSCQNRRVLGGHLLLPPAQVRPWSGAGDVANADSPCCGGVLIPDVLKFLEQTLSDGCARCAVSFLFQAGHSTLLAFQCPFIHLVCEMVKGLSPFRHLREPTRSQPQDCIGYWHTAKR